MSKIYILGARLEDDLALAPQRFGVIAMTSLIATMMASGAINQLKMRGMRNGVLLSTP